jgi:hypothetical protein
MRARAELTQRQRIERLLIDRGSRGAHSFEFYADGMPRAAVVVSRLKRAGWDISAVPEPSPSGGQGVRYVLRAAPGGRTASVGDAASNVCALPEPEQPPLFETAAAGMEHWRSEVA